MIRRILISVSRELFPAVISLFPLTFSRVRFLTFLGGRPHGLMLIHENGRLSIEHSLPRTTNKGESIASLIAILAAIASRDSGCQDVHRKWENQRKLNRKQGIRRIVTVTEPVGSSSRLVLS